MRRQKVKRVVQRRAEELAPYFACEDFSDE
jgi:hypothetical protein